MRLFIAIPLADATARELKELVARLQVSAPELRWSTPSTWHVTLQFLGNTAPEQFACLSMRLGQVRSAPVPIQLGETGCFDRAGVLFVDVAVTSALADLQKNVVAATARCGFIAEGRPFHPHITLARKAGSKLTKLIRQSGTRHAFTHFTASEFLLYESHLRSEGSRYEVRGRFPLV
jgi:RNA 2',3'-cyclic 3'-phosphodiesterase